MKIRPWVSLVLQNNWPSWFTTICKSIPKRVCLVSRIIFESNFFWKSSFFLCLAITKYKLNYFDITYNINYVTVQNLVIFNANIVRLLRVVKYCNRTNSDIGKVQLNALIQWQGWGFSSPLLVAIFAPTLNVRFKIIYLL